jgi:hypothetical protein
MDFDDNSYLEFYEALFFFLAQFAELWEGLGTNIFSEI